MKVYRLDGKVINIGNWDHGVKFTGEDEMPVAPTNPIPEGAVISEEEVIELSSGAKVVKSDVGKIISCELEDMGLSRQDVEMMKVMDSVNGTSTYSTHVSEIKAKYQIT